MSTDRKPLIHAVVLNEESRACILARFKPRFRTVWVHHLTIAFKPDYMPSDLGNEALFSIIGFAYDDCAQVCVASTDLRPSGIPHVTISTADDISPSYANSLLLRGFRMVKPFQVAGTVMIFDGDVWTDRLECIGGNG